MKPTRRRLPKASLSRPNKTLPAATGAMELGMVTSRRSPGLPGPSELLPFDETLLDRARTQWQHGDWSSLRKLDLPALESHPDRAKLALLAAAGCLQGGDIEPARRLVRQAIQWGCSKDLVSKVLVAGVHNSLGRTASVAGDEQRARQHFEAAIRTVDPHTDVKLLGHARTVREMVGLGMLPQAAAYVSQALDDAQEKTFLAARTTAHQKVLDLEVDWLRERVLQVQKQMQQGQAAPTIVKAELAPRQRTAGSAAADAPDGRRYFGLHDLDRKLAAYVDFDNGFFVELGANDGVAQSNTLHFEKYRGWRGILIEPILHSFLMCKQNRAVDNQFYCAACVSSTYTKPYVALTYANLMTTPSGLDSDIQDPRHHAESGQVYLAPGETTVDVMAAARTLQSVLDDASAPALVDLLSLDVEGAELEVLKGIDHQRSRFRFMLIESRDPNRLQGYLQAQGYRLIDKLSRHDYLFAPR